jgi:hypothetical protein
MNVGPNNGWRRAARRLLAGTVLTAGVIAGTAVPASAATTSTFSSGVLTVTGDSANNSIVISRDAAGRILVNGGAVAVVGGTPTVANTAQIRVFGLDGQDVITLSEINGALPAANLFGGAGNDTSRAAPAPTSSSARAATTRSWAAVASTCCSAAARTTP